MRPQYSTYSKTLAISAACTGTSPFTTAVITCRRLVVPSCRQVNHHKKPETNIRSREDLREPIYQDTAAHITLLNIIHSPLGMKDGTHAEESTRAPLRVPQKRVFLIMAGLQLSKSTVRYQKLWSVTVLVYLYTSLIG